MDKKWHLEEQDGYCLIHNEGGALLGISSEHKEQILTVDGYAFKNLSKSGVLEPYEDWRLPLEERVQDLVTKMTLEEIAGLMLYSSHQAICKENPLAAMMYPDGKAPDNRQHSWELTDEQRQFITEENVRHVLIAMVDDTPTAARWNNEAQALSEGTRLGIPINISSDPRHTPAGSAEFDMGAGGDISVWPEHIGLAATFDPDIVERFGQVASKEYRAMGITTALSPQIDIATEPRWNRFNGTFGESPKLSADMARAYCDGFQSSKEDAQSGWGSESVNVMAKHWPGGGSGESGRDAHFGYGKHAVYPGNNFDMHLKPFTEGAFSLKGNTGKAAAIMPYYTISYDQDKKYGENVGNGYSKYMIKDLLRGEYEYDGVVCTDWNITHDPGPIDTFFGGKCWGTEDLTVAQRHYKVLMAGVDQFGGNNDAKPVLEAYEMGVKEFGEDTMRSRFEQSAKRLLRNIFQTNLFENPYLNPEESRSIAGCKEFVADGMNAQLKSIPMLKNANQTLPLAAQTKVFIPKRHIKAGQDWFGRTIEAHDSMPVDINMVKQTFEVVDTPEEADCAFCFIESPKSKEYSKEEGCLPISLQYRPYTAHNAREKSIASSDLSYKGKTNTTRNEPDLDMILQTKQAMGEKPVIVIAKTTNPFVTAEFEEAADAILLDFSVETEAIMAILSGKAEPSALLPFQMPKDMDTVETQQEDVPFDMIPYTDSCGNVYDFGYGLNFSGVITDERTKYYAK